MDWAYVDVGDLMRLAITYSVTVTESTVSIYLNSGEVRDLSSYPITFNSGINFIDEASGNILVTVGGNGTSISYASPIASRILQPPSISIPRGSYDDTATHYYIVQYDVTANGIRFTGNSLITLTESVPAHAPNYIYYNANGGRNAPPTTTKPYNESVTLSTSEPAWTDHVFRYWNTTAYGTGTTYQKGASIPYNANNDMTLYAIWYNPYDVTYNGNASGVSNIPASQVKIHGTNLTLSSQKPTRQDGYVFKVWNTRSDGLGTDYTPGATYSSNANVVLYAQWWPPHTVTYNGNRGSETVSQVTNVPANQQKLHGTNLSITSQKPSMAGYSFVKWNTNASGTGTDYAPNASYSTESDLTLYAVWNPVVESTTLQVSKTYRTDSLSSETPADEGTAAYIDGTFTITGASIGTVSLTCDRVNPNGTTTPLAQLIQDGKASLVLSGTTSKSSVGYSSYSGSFKIRDSELPVTNQYVYKLHLAVSGTTGGNVSDDKSTTLEKAFYTVSFLGDGNSGMTPGHGIAFGMPATREAFEVGASMPAYFHNELIVTDTKSKVDDSSGYTTVPIAKTYPKSANPESGISDLGAWLKSLKSLIGTYMDTNNKWWNILSIRHRNGYGDGSDYGMYIRTALTSSENLLWCQQRGGTWRTERTILDSSNYSNYAASNTHSHNNIVSRGNVTCETGTNLPGVAGVSMSQVYNNGYPTAYGNLITLCGGGHSQLLLGWSGTSGAHAPVYVRSKRDVDSANWSDWAQVYTTANKPTYSDVGAASSGHSHSYSDVGAAAANHTHSYLPLSGGTVSGNLTVNSSFYSSYLNASYFDGNSFSSNADNPYPMLFNYSPDTTSGTRASDYGHVINIAGNHAWKYQIAFTTYPYTSFMRIRRNINNAGWEGWQTLKVVPTVFYNNASGSNSNLDLGGNYFNNYNHCRIHYMSNEGYHGCTDIYDPHDKKVTLSISRGETGSPNKLWVKSRTVYLAWNALNTYNSNQYAEYGGNSDQQWGINAYNYIYITRIECWNE